MTTVIDANVLVALFAKRHDDRRDARVKGLIEDTRKSGHRLLIPSPALAEFAVKASQAELDFITTQQIFRVAPFDAKAALECADLMRHWVEQGIKKDRHKAKFDMQILAIAKAAGSRRLVTCDTNLRNRCSEQSIIGLDIMDLPIPDAAKQFPMFEE